MSDRSQHTMIVVDDHTLFRQALADMLAGAGCFAVVAEGSSGMDAIELAGKHKPEIALLDVEMPGPSPQHTVREVLAASPTTRIAMLTMHEDIDVIRSFVGIGVHAYLTKSLRRHQLVAALKTVCIDDAMQVAVGRVRLGATRNATVAGSTLTPRELELLRCAALAMSNRQIATTLNITESTVKRHLTNVFAKLSAVSRLDAVRRAQAAGLIPFDDL